MLSILKYFETNQFTENLTGIYDRDEILEYICRSIFTPNSKKAYSPECKVNCYKSIYAKIYSILCKALSYH